MPLKWRRQFATGIKTMDKIHIYGLDIYAHHGVYPAENQLGQHFFVNATLYTDMNQAGRSDELDNTTNYGEICHFITDYLQNNTFKLLEAAAEHTAHQLLTHFPLIHQVDLELQKPSAPIGLPLKTVSVEISRGWKRAYIALGSNMGDKEKFLRDAVDELNGCAEIRVKRVSTLITTAPYGGVEQDDFLNGAAEIETLLSPDQLLEELHRIEGLANRVRVLHWGPRTLDLDILLYENEVMQTERLTIPHADMVNRDFVLRPMAEIAPHTLHPVYRKTMKMLWDELEKRSC